VREDVACASPALDDGVAMWRIARSVDLDANSQYKYLLFCRDFTDTSVVARLGSGPVGFVTGYRRPHATDTLFVWQVGVLPAFRGRGIAGQMLDYLHGTLGVSGVAHVEATVTPRNTASLRLFTGFATRHGANLTRSVLFPTRLFAGDHDEEVLVRIGPFPDAGTPGADSAPVRNHDDVLG
jgi:L-2,4-diaminobutyric acid acetyltransferase